MLADIKMLFFNIRHTYFLASPPKSQAALDCHRQFQGDPLAPRSGSENWCHIRHCPKSTTSFWIPFQSFSAPVHGGRYLPLLHRKIQNETFIHPLRMWTPAWVVKVEPTTFYSSKHIAMQAAILPPLSPTTLHIKH